MKLNKEKFGNYKEYVENIDKVVELLNKHDFEMVENPLQARQYMLYINDIGFEYSEGEANEMINSRNKQEKILNAIWCVLMDISCYLESKDFIEFAENFGYNNYREAQRIYEACKVNYEKMLKLFTESEIEFLQENIQL